MKGGAMMTIAQLIEAVGGHVASPIGDGAIAGISTDSRSVAPGDLFVALAGEKFDGHDFIDTAARSGAAGVLVHHDVSGNFGIPIVRVADTRLALGRLAGWWRDRHQSKVVALTGSNGKTTVKDMVASILREACDDAAAVLATEGNLNNDIGMPLTLLKLRGRHSYAVLEMGMNHIGEIDYLARIANPDVALVNNAHRAHVGELGDVEKIAIAKGEIFAGVKNDGIALINVDDAFAPYWTQVAAGRKQITFGLNAGDVRGDYKETTIGTSVVLTTPVGKIETMLQVPGEHNVRNAIAACAVAISLDIRADAIGRGLAKYAGTKGRLQKKNGLSGAALIDDTYNANPDSMAAALAVLAKANGRRIFVMGDMGELGEDAAAMHAEIGLLAKKVGVERLLALGDFTSRAVEAFGAGGQHFAGIAHLVDELRPLLQKDTTVLIKGSRFMRMERVVEAVSTPMGH